VVKTYRLDISALSHTLTLSLAGADADIYTFECWVYDADTGLQICHGFLNISTDFNCPFVVPANTTFMYMSWPPSTIYAGQRFSVSGYLFFDWDGDGIYETPLSGKSVILVYDSSQIGNGITDSNGYFDISGYIYQTGNFTLKVKFLGE
jgi:hypothetical protein